MLQINDDVVEHQATGDQLEAGAGEEAQEGADGGLEGSPGALVLNKEFREEGAQQAAQDHPDGRDEHPGEKADDRPDARGLMPAGDPGQHPRDDEIHHGHYHRDYQPDQQESQPHRLPRPVQSLGEEGQQQPHPADRRARNAGYDAPNDADQRQQNREYFQYDHLSTNSVPLR